ncbi:hypothetical protein QWZ10_06080 [Paracoccus cavernae]|uniref:Uncharacterized protein n=1 Tax=Paracoccus cavernae TaxID=1571207 RepID=A0ABT8D6H3_9RHOB|nr:hypothetical protein [Paracoccus cavernae]
MRPPQPCGKIVDAAVEIGQSLWPELFCRARVTRGSPPGERPTPRSTRPGARLARTEKSSATL